MKTLTNKNKIKIFLNIKRKEILEYVRFESYLASLCLTLFYLIHLFFLKLKFDQYKALIIAGKIFRHTQFNWIRKIAACHLLRTIKKSGTQRVGSELLKIVSKEIDLSLIGDLRQSVVSATPGLFHNRLLILSPPMNGKKGVLILKYTNYIKYFLNIFDVEILSKDYILIVEPSSAGYFDEDILCLLSSDIQVMIQSPEPVDYNFMSGLSPNIWPIDIGANYWVDSRKFFKDEKIAKEYDVILVSNWSDCKRHYKLFKSLSKIDNSKLKIVLVGKPWPRSKYDIEEEALYYKVRKNIEFYENVSQEELNTILNRSKSYFLLSKIGRAHV